MIGRIVDGARNSLFVGIGATVIALVVGTAIGLFAGYRRGRSDQALVVGLDVFAAFPPTVAVLAAVFIWGPGLEKLTVVLGVLGIFIFARIARAVTLPLADREFVLAAATGAGHTRVMLRELLPNIAVPVMAYGLVTVGLFVIIEGALSFYGTGLPEGYDSWGKLIAAGQEQVETAPHLVIIPTMVLVATVVALNSISERWQERWLFGNVPRSMLRTPIVSGEQASTEARPDGLRSTPPGVVVDPDRALVIEHLHTWLATPIGDVRAVTDVDLVLRAGSLTALVGESGSGKTMLARSVLGLVTTPTVPDLPGRIMFGDVDLRSLPADELRKLRGRRVAMVFQDPMTSLDPVQRISRQVTEPMRAHLGYSKEQARGRAIDLLEQVGCPTPYGACAPTPTSCRAGCASGSRSRSRCPAIPTC